MRFATTIRVRTIGLDDIFPQRYLLRNLHTLLSNDDLPHCTPTGFKSVKILYGVIYKFRFFIDLSNVPFSSAHHPSHRGRETKSVYV